jgi:hypothetical protein
MARTRALLRAIVLAAAATISSVPYVVHAAWDPAGATIKSTSSVIPEVAACSDGSLGAIVLWQEETSSGVGVLRAQHVLATGDVDPAWPADGVIVCSVTTARSALGAVSDDLGGAYLWWLEGTGLFLSRFEAGGAIAAGWPARGRFLGALTSLNARPSVIGDGVHGVYATWVRALSVPDENRVMGIHLGPSNTGAGGWPNSARSLSPDDVVTTYEFWPQTSLAPDGGAFVAWATLSTDANEVPSAWRLARVGTNGLTASGWPDEGLSIGEFVHDDPVEPLPPSWSHLAIADDGAGGVFLNIVNATSASGYGYPEVDPRLHRLQGDGTLFPGWPSEGAAIANVIVAGDVGPDGAARVFPGASGEALVGLPFFSVHWPYYTAARVTAGGAPYPEGAGSVSGVEMVPSGTGSVFMGSFHPQGPSGPYQPNAHIQLHQFPEPPGWTGFYEFHDEIVVSWYGDIAVSPTEDGGCVFFWSQHRERFGLFARRFSATQELLDVQAPTLPLGRLTARFVRGSGVVVSFALPEPGRGRVDLFDLAGRRVASARFEAASAGEQQILLEGTARLPAGLWFARVEGPGTALSGKVIAVR